MKCIIDIECNSLVNPTKVWVVVCKDIDSNQVYIFRNLHTDDYARHDFIEFAKGVSLWIGHNIIEYDFPCLERIIGLSWNVGNLVDTLIVSRLTNYSRPAGHSLSSYGVEFGLPKISFNDWTKWSQDMEDYCVRDVEINHVLYNACRVCTDDPLWKSAIALEQEFQLIANDLNRNGFYFNVKKANGLLSWVQGELRQLDDRISTAFPPREVLIREFCPRATKYGTISKTSVPRSLWDKLHEYEIGKSYRHTRLDPFNPSSHKQLIEVLNDAKWQPEDRTDAHIDVERELNTLSRSPGDNAVQLGLLRQKLSVLKRSGWKVNELNLSTLPSSAPEPARLLAKRILLEARRRSLVEWLGLVKEDGRIHGKFVGIGAWTHRMAHQRPNTANIPTAVQLDGSVKLLGKELRELWCAPKGKLLAGVDAEGIQLRIFAHYIDDQEFTHALEKGSKSDKSDPHSLNQRVLGSVCKTRQAAKRFIFALLLGGGIGKLSQILECSRGETTEALDRLLERYTGFKRMRQTVLPKDAKRGYLIGLDGRRVQIPGETESKRKHLAMSGYLQNGEAVIIKKAALLSDAEIRSIPRLNNQWKFVNIVHDELQNETSNRLTDAIEICRIQANAIKEAGEYYKLKCKLAGSYWNDDNQKYTIGTDWYQTH